MSKSMRPGGVQNARLFGESLSDDIPGLNIIQKDNKRERHLIRNNDDGNWSGPIIDAINIIQNTKTNTGMVRFVAELQSEYEIMYTVFFSFNRGSDSSGDKGAVPEAYRVNVPYKISQIQIWGSSKPLYTIDDEKWRYYYATGPLSLGGLGLKFEDKQTQNLMKSATGSILKIEPNGEPVIIGNAALLGG